MIKPLNNHCLIEVIDEYDGVVRNNSQEEVRKGVLRDFLVSNLHLTASAALCMPDSEVSFIGKNLKAMAGKTVYWEEYSDAGKKFTIEGKDYVLIPFYRLIGFEEETK